MPVALAPIIAPGRVALVLMDLQQVLLSEDESALYGSDNVDRLVEAAMALAVTARAAGIPVLHCPKLERRDGRGAAFNAPMWWGSRRDHTYRTPAGSDAAQIITALGPEPEDLVVPRTRGASIFTGTELDFLLRGLGLRSLVIGGISLNVGIIGACIEAVSRGYDVVVPTDGVAAIPASYADAMLAGSIRPVAVLSSSAEITALWVETGNPPAPVG